MTIGKVHPTLPSYLELIVGGEMIKNVSFLRFLLKRRFHLNDMYSKNEKWAERPGARPGDVM